MRENKRNNLKVILINGSPHERGNTAHALSDIAEVLHEEEIETTVFWVGSQLVHGCIDCSRCHDNHRCVFNEDITNSVLDEIEKSDGLIIGSPTYFGNASGTLRCILDRMFHAGNRFAHKPAAAITVSRRAGNVCALYEIYRYFTVSEMPIVTSTNWPVEFGNKPGETEQDLEGIFTEKRLAANMAWLVKCI
ncbi:MAG: flavodoxin family protein [Eubacteriaceae bacterium]|jgi:multimeric flavodoxin WrbA